MISLKFDYIDLIEKVSDLDTKVFKLINFKLQELCDPAEPERQEEKLDMQHSKEHHQKDNQS